MKRVTFLHVVEPYNELDPIDDRSLPDDPFDLFARWAKEALLSVDMPHAVSLATADPDSGRPSCRIVLIKEVTPRGLKFYTNYLSRKGREIERNPQGAITFFWMPLYRQVRVEGKIEKLPVEESDAYFNSRPRASQIAAWASRQSEPVASRDDLMKKFFEEEKRWEGKPVERPPWWGGYVLIPDRWEFWQGHPSRLHDRIEYVLTDTGWDKHRLFP